jgi:hypothetical protein
MTKERLELARLLQETINLLIELESYLAEFDPTAYQRLAAAVAPRLVRLKQLIT